MFLLCCFLILSPRQRSSRCPNLAGKPVQSCIGPSATELLGTVIGKTEVFRIPSHLQDPKQKEFSKHIGQVYHIDSSTTSRGDKTFLGVEKGSCIPVYLRA